MKYREELPPDPLWEYGLLCSDRPRAEIVYTKYYPLGWHSSAIAVMKRVLNAWKGEAQDTSPPNVRI